MRDAFESGAKAYKRKFSRPPILVIDGADFLMGDDTELVKKLVTRAKALARPPLARASACRARMLPAPPCVLGCHFGCLTSEPYRAHTCAPRSQTWADQGVARVVFVSSPGRFMEFMRGAASPYIPVPRS